MAIINIDSQTLSIDHMILKIISHFQVVMKIIFEGRYFKFSTTGPGKKKGKSVLWEVNLKINGKWVQRLGIRLVNTFDQKIFIFEEPKEIFII